MHKKHFSLGRARVAALVVAVASAIALGAPALARADAVTTWNTYATGALIGTAAQPPTVAAIHLAMVQGAVYDAVNAIDGGHEGYLISSRLATPFDSKDAAAAAAAYRVLLNIVPAQQSVLDAQYAASLAGIPDSSSKTRGIAVGEAAAAAMIAARTDDGRFGPFRFVTGSGPGVWKPVLPGLRQRPERVGQGREAVHDPQRVAVPLRRAAAAHEPQVREGVRRGEVRRLADEHDADRRPDLRRALLERAARGNVEPDRPHDLGRARADASPTTRVCSRSST